jgi:hypothetical protein
MSQRVLRLTGVGVPITDAFRAVVEEIIDNGPADFDTLNKRVQSAMYLKEKRILSGAWRTWEDFTRDIVAQISGGTPGDNASAKRTLMLIADKYSAIEFTRGAEYVAIDQPRITYTVWDEETRHERDLDARDEMETVRLHSDVQRHLETIRHPAALEYYRKAERALWRAQRVYKGHDEVPEPQQDEPDGTIHPAAPKKRTGLLEGTEQAYKQFAGRWFNATMVTAYWNVHHPDQEPLPNSSGAITRKLKADTESGRLTRRGTVGLYEYYVN